MKCWQTSETRLLGKVSAAEEHKKWCQYVRVHAFTSTYMYRTCKLAPFLAKDSMPSNGSPRDLCLNSVAYLKINVSVAVFLVTLIPLSLSCLHEWTPLKMNFPQRHTELGSHLSSTKWDTLQWSFLVEYQQPPQHNRLQFLWKHMLCLFHVAVRFRPHNFLRLPKSTMHVC